MQLSVSPRQYSVLIYEDNTDRYTSSFQVFVIGDRGFMYTLNGHGFYSCFQNIDKINQLFEELNVNSIEGYLTPEHLKVMKRKLKDVISLEEIDIGEINGFPMVWVLVKKRKVQNAST